MPKLSVLIATKTLPYNISFRPSFVAYVFETFNRELKTKKNYVIVCISSRDDLLQITTIDVLQTFANGLSFIEEINF
jgi:hypothetical protein